ncbi:MAG: ATP-binding protein [Pseudomonadota bacterium]
MGFLQRNLHVRLIVCFIVFALCPLGVIGLMAYQSGRNSMVSHVKSHLESIAILKEQEIENWVEHLEHDLAWVVTSPEIIRDAAILTTHTVDAARYRKAHEVLNASFKKIEALGHVSPVFLLDPSDGRIIASSIAAWEGKIRVDDPYFIQVLQGKKDVFISGMFFSLTLDRPTMVISAPINDNNGDLVGVVAAHADLKRLNEIMLERSGVNKTVETFLVNRSNLLITNTVFAPNGAFNKWIFGQGARWALEGKSGVGQFLDYRGEKVIGAYRWLERSNMALIVKQDESEALANALALRDTIFVIGMVASVLSILLSLYFSRFITVPISRLVKGVREIGSGNLDYKIESKAKDEIGVLASAFNQMSASLKNITVSRNELEKEISDRKRAETAQQSERKRAQQYLNIAGVMIVAINADQTVSLVNKKACHILGCDEADIVGKNWFDSFLREEEREAVKDIFNRIMSGEVEQAAYFENYILNSDDEPRLVAWNNSVLTNPEGHILGTLSSGEDITERRQIENELANHRKHLEESVSKRTAELNQRISEVEQLNSAMVNLLEDLRISNENLEIRTRELKAVNRELESFSYSVSHDLRAPLRAVTGFSQILVEEYGHRLDAEGHRKLLVIQNSAMDMSQLIDDLLSFSRHGRKNLSLVDIDMAELAREVFDKLQIGVADPTARLNIDTLPHAKGDRSMVREVYLNLLSNAIKYARSETETVIEVTGKADGDENIYSVKDNGIGFDMKYKDKIFDVFQRLHKSDEFEGTGVGLALVQRIVHRHGGRLWAEGEVDKGAVFYFSLPKSET